MRQRRHPDQAQSPLSADSVSSVPNNAPGERGSGPQVSRPAAASVRPASEAVVKARDAAILARLHIGPATLEQLVTVLPAEPGESETDRQVACSSALIRLRVKKQITAAAGNWAIA